MRILGYNKFQLCAPQIARFYFTYTEPSQYVLSYISKGVSNYIDPIYLSIKQFVIPTHQSDLPFDVKINVRERIKLDLCDMIAIVIHLKCQPCTGQDTCVVTTLYCEQHKNLVKPVAHSILKCVFLNVFNRHVSAHPFHTFPRQQTFFTKYTKREMNFEGVTLPLFSVAEKSKIKKMVLKI